MGIFVDISATRILVVLFQGLKHIGNAEIHAAEFLRIEGYLILLKIAAKAGHVGHALHTQHLPAYDPVLDGAQLHGRVFIFISLFGVNDVLEYFAQAGGYRRQLGRSHAGRQVDCSPAIRRSLTC